MVFPALAIGLTSFRKPANRAVTLNVAPLDGEQYIHPFFYQIVDRGCTDYGPCVLLTYLLN